jgi:hypothetical protein
MRKLIPLLLFIASTHLFAEESKVTTSHKGFGVEGEVFIALQVIDDVAASKWYRTTFDLEEVNHLEAPNGKASIRILSGGGLTIELIDHVESATAPIGYQHGLFKAGFHVDDIDTAFDWLLKQGVFAGIGIFTDQALKARSFVFKDPWGNRLQIFQRCDDECAE